MYKRQLPRRVEEKVEERVEKKVEKRVVPKAWLILGSILTLLGLLALKVFKR